MRRLRRVRRIYANKVGGPTSFERPIVHIEDLDLLVLPGFKFCLLKVKG